MLRLRRTGLLPLPLLLFACAGEVVGDSADAGPDAAPLAWDGAVPAAAAWLEIHALDIWARPLPAGAALSVRRDGAVVPTQGWPVALAPLTAAGTYRVSLAAADHLPLEVDVVFDGDDGLGAAAARWAGGSPRGGLAATHEEREMADGERTVHGLYLGLEHAWFSSEGRPPRPGNRLRFLMDGEEAWAAVHADLTAAVERILISTWWWESDFELVRGWDTALDPAARAAQTILGVLEASPATTRVLVGQLWGQDGVLSWVTVDDALLAHADDLDGIEVMGEGNWSRGVFWFEVAPFLFGDRVRAATPAAALLAFDPEEPVTSLVPPHEVDMNAWPVDFETDHGSIHQKFMVIDDQVAYVGGMNLRHVDWDTSAHLVFDERRLPFDATVAEREAVRDREEPSSIVPRKDYMVRIDGPAAQDAAEVFQRRWRHQLTLGVDHAAASSDFEVDRDLAAYADGVTAQITATLPQPYDEHAIAETWFKAVVHADRYILVEDQYWRVPMLRDAIVARMNEVPTLKLVVITLPVSEWTDPGCPWTARENAVYSSAFPDRYLTLQLRSFDFVDVGWGIDETESRFSDIYIHSKLLIVDDELLSVGSCNKNNRGLVYEAELNVAVHDAAWVTAARRRVLENILPPGTAPSDDADVWYAQLVAAAAWNDRVYAAWDEESGDLDLDGAPLPSAYTPAGFVYSLSFRRVEDCLLEDVGPDMTIW